MRIESVRIQNLRSMNDATISLSGYTCLVGPNGAGKSNVLCALNIFFRETGSCPTDLAALGEEDFHHKNTNDPIRITVMFTELSDEAKDDFAHYYRHEKLIVSAVAEFDDATGKAAVKQYGQRQGLAGFKPFFEADKRGDKVPELQAIYAGIRVQHPELPQASTKAAMQKALHEYEGNHSEQLEAILSEDEFYGCTRGANLLAKYVQWVYVPAVKDASSEQMEARNTALGKLLARTVRAKTSFDEKLMGFRKEWCTEYQALLDENQAVLDEISAALANRLSSWYSADARLRVQWRQDPEKSVRVEEPWAQIIAGEGEFEGELARFGHGLQRSYLLALLQELSGSDDETGPTLILACEEPELYQHPPQARHLANVFQQLSKGNSQVLISTHSPYFVSGERFEDVRMIRKQDGRSVVSCVSYQEVSQDIAAAKGQEAAKPSGTLAKIHQALQTSLSEMFFTPHLILVEGLEDLAYITTYLNLLSSYDNYRRYGCHIVPTDGKSEMLRPLVVARRLGIPVYCVLDADGDKPDRNGSRKKHETDNTAILRMLHVADPEPFPNATYWGEGVVMWPSDLATVVASEIGEPNWHAYCSQADREYGCAGNLGKNSLHIAKTLTLAWEDGKRVQSLEKLCKTLLGFGEQR